MLDQMPDTREKILIVIAHPDDESLWFLAGIKSLSHSYSIDLFCLTYSEDSFRGQELKSACRNLNLKIFFGEVEDLGIHSCVQSVDKALRKHLENFSISYKMMITHPPHGGEKPHPHHIQLFHATRALCYEKSLDFGFFSEKLLLSTSANDEGVSFSLQMETLEFIRFIKILFFRRINTGFFAKECVKATKYYLRQKGSKSFYLTTFQVDPSEKQIALSHYHSQIEFLKKYASFFQSAEYLYSSAPLHKQRSEEKIMRASV